jgi:predicted DCC family thiol-disulfide oxidoreductase YuxK
MTDPRVPVLLYDGECGLCNGVVLFMLRHDRKGVLHFAPLQSEPGQGYLLAQGLPTAEFGSLVFVPDWNDPRLGGYLLRTDGALAAFAELDSAWRAVSWLRIIPKVLRDAVYTLISKTRYAVFGEYRPKPLPDPAWKMRFLQNRPGTPS